MKHLLLSISIVLLAAGTCSAQTTSLAKLSLGGELGLPTGSDSPVHGTVIGASVKLEIPLKAMGYEVVFTGGISEYLNKLDYTGTAPLITAFYLPVEGGFRYYFSKVAYVEADAGVSLNLNNTNTRAAFIYSPVIGVSAPTNKHKAFVDIGLRFEDRVEVPEI